MRLLHVDDKLGISQIVKKAISSQGYVVDTASTTDEASELVFVEEYDLLIVDRRLGSSQGLDLCRELRSENNQIPIIVLSEMNQPEERITGIDAGADDYIGIPFHIGELNARVRTQLKRSVPVVMSFVFGDLKFDSVLHRAVLGNVKLDLLPKEYAILEYLVRSQGAVRTRAQIGENVWGYDFEPRSNLIESYIIRLRSKLGGNFRNGMIRTIPGVGYALRGADEEI